MEAAKEQLSYKSLCVQVLCQANPPVSFAHECMRPKSAHTPPDSGPSPRSGLTDSSRPRRALPVPIAALVDERASGSVRRACLLLPFAATSGRGQVDFAEVLASLQKGGFTSGPLGC